MKELFNVSRGAAISRKFESDEGYYYLHYGDIHKSDKTIMDLTKDNITIPKINIEPDKITENQLLKNDDIVLTDASEDYADLCKPILIKMDNSYVFIGGLHTLIIKKRNHSVSSLFITYFFQSQAMKHQVLRFATGITVYGMNKTNLEQIRIPIPPLSEQKKIATILSSVDQQIQQEREEFNKLQRLKKGLMQQLLTGRLRVFQ